MRLLHVSGIDTLGVRSLHRQRTLPAALSWAVIGENGYLLDGNRLDTVVSDEVFIVTAGIVRFRSRETQFRIAELRAHAAQGFTDTPQSRIFAQTRNRPLPLMLRGVIERDPRGGERITVAVLDLEAPPHIPEDLLRAALRLTEAEAALASALVGGETLQSVAARTGVRVSTLRTQLASVLAKTGATRQAQLVAIISRVLILSSEDSSWH